MSPEHPNAQLLRRLYSGDRELLLRNLAPEYKVHVPGRSGASGTFPGAEGHLKHVRLLTELSGNTLRLQTFGTFLADDLWGVVPGRVTGSRAGKNLDLQAFGLWRFRDGLAAEHWTLTADQNAFDEFFS